MQDLNQISLTEGQNLLTKINSINRKVDFIIDVDNTILNFFYKGKDIALQEFKNDDCHYFVNEPIIDDNWNYMVMLSKYNHIILCSHCPTVVSLKDKMNNLVAKLNNSDANISNIEIVLILDNIDKVDALLLLGFNLKDVIFFDDYSDAVNAFIKLGYDAYLVKGKNGLCNAHQKNNLLK